MTIHYGPSISLLEPGQNFGIASIDSCRWRLNITYPDSIIEKSAALIKASEITLCPDYDYNSITDHLG